MFGTWGVVALLSFTLCTLCPQYMDYDYHASFRRLSGAYRESEHESCEALMASADNLVEQAKSLNFENDLHYFLSEYSQPFTPPNPFQFTAFEGDTVCL